MTNKAKLSATGLESFPLDEQLVNVKTPARPTSKIRPVSLRIDVYTPSAVR